MLSLTIAMIMAAVFSSQPLSFNVPEENSSPGSSSLAGAAAAAAGAAAGTDDSAENADDDKDQEQYGKHDRPGKESDAQCFTDAVLS